MHRMMLICLAFVMSLGFVYGQAEEKFDVNSVIAAPVRDLGEPKFWEGVGDLDLMVFTDDDSVRKHVNQGFVLLHASWDFEAYRHFTTALKKDPNCLMAYCGIVLSLANPAHEWKGERARAFNRMITLAEYKVGEGDDAKWYYPDIERGYAFCIATLFTEGTAPAAQSFRKLATKYPKDLQLQLLAAFLERGGYSEFGDVRPSQRRSLEKIKALVDEHPENPLVLNFWLMMQAEAPYQAVDILNVLMPTAKKLVILSEGKMPTWHAVLGHMAWRCGELELARISFEQSIELYSKWQKENGVTDADATGLIRAKIFLAAVYYDEGKTEEALKLLAEVNSISIPQDRMFSQSAIAIRWHANLMPFGIYLAKGQEGDLAKAAEALPKMVGRPETGFDPYKATLDAYTVYVRALEAIAAGKLEEARVLHSKMAEHLILMQKAQSQMISQPYFADYARIFSALSVHHLELAGLITDNEGAAFNLFKAAIDKQLTSSRLLPPETLYPMEYRLAEYYQKREQKDEALKYVKEGLKRMPSCPKSKALLKSLE